MVDVRRCWRDYHQLKAISIGHKGSALCTGVRRRRIFILTLLSMVALFCVDRKTHKHEGQSLALFDSLSSYEEVWTEDTGCTRSGIFVLSPHVERKLNIALIYSPRNISVADYVSQECCVAVISALLKRPDVTCVALATSTPAIGILVRRAWDLMISYEPNGSLSVHQFWPRNVSNFDTRTKHVEHVDETFSEQDQGAQAVGSSMNQKRLSVRFEEVSGSILQAPYKHCGASDVAVIFISDYQIGLESLYDWAFNVIMNAVVRRDSSLNDARPLALFGNGWESTPWGHLAYPHSKSSFEKSCCKGRVVLLWRTGDSKLNERANQLVISRGRSHVVFLEQRQIPGTDTRRYEETLLNDISSYLSLSEQLSSEILSRAQRTILLSGHAGHLMDSLFTRMGIHSMDGASLPVYFPNPVFPLDEQMVMSSVNRGMSLPLTNPSLAVCGNRTTVAARYIREYQGAKVCTLVVAFLEDKCTSTECSTKYISVIEESGRNDALECKFQSSDKGAAYTFGLKDPRLFCYQNQLAVVYNSRSSTVLGASRACRGTIVKQSIAWVLGSYAKMEVAHHRFLDYAYSQEVEKNWMPFVYNGKIFYSRSLNPHNVVSCDSSPCVDVANTSNVLELWHLQIGGGSPSILVDWFDEPAFYLGVAHVQAKYRHYENFAFKFRAAPPFEIYQISAWLPLYSQPRRNGGSSLVAFVSGLAYSHGAFLISYGQGDVNSRLLTLSNEQMNAMFSSRYG
jgi:hypothetical protein